MIDRRIKFRHIQCFVEICREGSFKAAAKALFLTQPAISKTLKELEEIIGHTLLHRDRGGIRLTAQGETFLHFAQTSIASLQQGIDGLGSSDLAPRATVSVGVMPSVAARLIPSVAERFGRMAPQVVLRLTDGPYGYLVDRLKMGDLDLVIGRMGNHTQMQGLAFSALYRERVGFIVRSGHPLLDRPNLRDVFSWPVVYPAPGSAIRPLVDRFLVEQGVPEIERRIETVSGAFGRVYVQSSDAVWIISEGVVANEIERGVLARLPIDTDTTLGPIGITTRADWDFTPPAKQFRTALGQAIDTAPDLTP